MSASAPELDLIAIGRCGIDLYGEQLGGRLEDMLSFAKYAGGSPTNTAIGVARLGLKSALLTRVGADHFGRFLKEQLTRDGVDVRGVIDDQERLTALVFLGIRDPETFPLIFYRENCADMALCEADVSPDFIASAAAVLINGTHLSRPSVFAASLKAAKAAKAAGRRVVFDIDYRPVLWGLAAKDMGENRFVASREVTGRLQEVVGLCDLIVGTEEEFHILGGSEDTIAALRAVRAKTGALLVCKRGPMGCSAFEHEVPDSLDEGVSGPGFPVEVFNVLGAGDAFMAGFLRGWLRGAPLDVCCTYANACGAIVVSRHGCAPAMPSEEELYFFLDMENRPARLREDAELEHVHWVTAGRTGHYPRLMALAMDHRSQFESLAKELGADLSRVAAFKALAIRAVDRLAQGDPHFGVLLDGRIGMRALEAAAAYPYWIGRPIELPGSRPLSFEGGGEAAAELRDWPPNHVVKCLAFYHPDDPPEMRAAQERRLLDLQTAARQTRREWLQEVICSGKDRPAPAPDTVARVLQRFYDLGMKPDWWKLEPDNRAEAWAEIERVIAKNDPYCRGVVLLGLSAPEQALIVSFKAAAACSAVKGFAVGRTIWSAAARDWLAGKITDEEAVADLARRFGVLVDAWRAAKGDAPALRAVV